MNRRKFLKNSSLSTAGIISAPILASCENKKPVAAIEESKTIKPIAICTWNFKNANDKAWDVLAKGGNSLDAVEQGVMIEEAT